MAHLITQIKLNCTDFICDYLPGLCHQRVGLKTLFIKLYQLFFQSFSVQLNQ